MEECCKKEEEIEKELEKVCNCKSNNKNNTCMGSGNCIYGLGMIGAAIFFIGNSNSFLTVVLAILKAIVWPVFMVYELLKFLIK